MRPECVRKIFSRMWIMHLMQIRVCGGTCELFYWDVFYLYLFKSPKSLLGPLRSVLLFSREMVMFWFWRIWVNWSKFWSYLEMCITLGLESKSNPIWFWIEPLCIFILWSEPYTKSDFLLISPRESLSK